MNMKKERPTKGKRGWRLSLPIVNGCGVLAHDPWTRNSGDNSKGSVTKLHSLVSQRNMLYMTKIDDRMSKVDISVYIDGSSSMYIKGSKVEAIRR